MKVFLDMDGVLTDFNRGVCEAFRRNDPSPTWTFWKDWDGVSFKDVNEKCDEEFWVNLNWTYDGVDIFQAVFEVFTNDIHLLTTPMPNLGSWTGKAKWVDRYVPIFNERLIVTLAPKSLLAGPDILLIDDRDENIEGFRAAGGQGILVPRSWNKNHDCQRSALDYVTHKLSEVIL